MRIRTPSLTLLLPVLAAAACSAAPPGREEAAVPPGPPPPLILLISLDTLRADRLDLYGYGRETAPNLARLAGDATVFTTAAAQAGQTLFSHKSLFTAKYPLRLLGEVRPAALEALASLEKPKRQAIGAFRKARGSLVGALREGGYRTVGFTDGGWMRRRFGFDEGFDLYNGKGGRFREILPRVIAWIEASGLPRGRAFLFVHAYDIHCPYTSRRPYGRMFCPDHRGHMSLRGLCGKKDMDPARMAPEDLRAVSDHYDAGVASADGYVGELLDHLRARGLYDEAMIVVFSDHGESLGEHGVVGHGGLYLEQLLVPLIIKMPASWRMEPSRIGAPVELVDLMPTILQAAGLPSPPPGSVNGRSLLPLLAGQGAGREVLTAHFGFREGTPRLTSLAKRALLVPGRWLVIDDLARGRTEAFDLEADPLGLTEGSPARVDEISSLVAAMEIRDRALLAAGASGARKASAEAPEEGPLPPGLLEELRSLGYID